ncbi:DUF551 domain-containing protein [Reyranella sp.]|uniref:DUF551 domain-containing protein n=1 Tax=Reyranella sp. TaxID=1929291 RepID=UPI0025CB8C78|nr:DUF551 domain-containing protein [Reyranella sp.]
MLTPRDAITCEVLEALKDLHADCVEYCRINHLHNDDGGPGTNHAMRRAAEAIANATQAATPVGEANTRDERAVTDNGWQPIETAPRDLSDVLVYRPGAVDPVIVAHQNIYGDWCSHMPADEGGFYLWKAAMAGLTHWMPLPAAPEVKP